MFQRPLDYSNLARDEQHGELFVRRAAILLLIFVILECSFAKIIRVGTLEARLALAGASVVANLVLLWRQGLSSIIDRGLLLATVIVVACCMPDVPEKKTIVCLPGLSRRESTIVSTLSKELFAYEAQSCNSLPQSIDLFTSPKFFGNDQLYVRDILDTSHANAGSKSVGITSSGVFTVIYYGNRLSSEDADEFTVLEVFRVSDPSSGLRLLRDHRVVPIARKWRPVSSPPPLF